tara:strand:+ start:2721 stop:3017 length:297 start_codon:yes stop_codon:yes gene_type:complete
MKKKIKLEQAVIRDNYTNRGGGVEIDLTPFGYKNQKMTAYQNYLGGDMLGAVANDCTIDDWEDDMELMDIAFELKILFCQNMGLDSSFLDVNRPVSVY